MNWLSRFLGYRDDLESENKYTYIITAFSFSFVALFLIFYITIIKSGIINLLTSICLAAVSLVFLLLKKKMFNFAKTLLLSAYLLQMLGLVFFWFPVEANFNFFYYTLPPISLLIFDIRIKQGQISLITLNTLALLMLVLSETLLLETPLIELSIQNIRFFGSLSALCSITSIIVVFYFYTVNLMKIYRKLDLIASTDDLTGTFNRRTLYK